MPSAMGGMASGVVFRAMVVSHQMSDFEYIFSRTRFASTQQNHRAAFPYLGWHWLRANNHFNLNPYSGSGSTLAIDISQSAPCFTLQ
jgi:hypothetical protein